MKRIAFVILFASCLAAAWAQPGKRVYEPNTNWPYLFEDFFQGTIVIGTDTVSRTRLNYHLRSEALQCIDHTGKIARVIFGNMNCVLVNNEVYRFVDGKLMRQMYAEEDAMLVDHQYIDYDVMDVSYMQGLATYARNTSETAMVANMNGHPNYKVLPMRGEFNELYDDMRQNWFDGLPLYTRHSYFFVVKGKVIHAVQGDCVAELSKADRRDFKAFLKSNHLKWNKKDDLVAILQYLKTIM